MSAESHKRYLQRKALQAARKTADRRGQDALTEGRIAGLRIQTVEPWKRIVLVVVGILFIVVGIASLGDEPLWLSIVLFAIAAACALAAAFGSKKTIEASLDAVDIVNLLEGFF